MVRLIGFFWGGGVYYYAIGSTKYIIASGRTKMNLKGTERKNPRGLIMVAYLHMPGGLRKTVSNLRLIYDLANVRIHSAFATSEVMLGTNIKGNGHAVCVRQRTLWVSKS
jgi:hypothetical protein